MVKKLFAPPPQRLAERVLSPPPGAHEPVGADPQVASERMPLASVAWELTSHLVSGVATDTDAGYRWSVPLLCRAGL